MGSQITLANSLARGLESQSGIICGHTCPNTTYTQVVNKSRCHMVPEIWDHQTATFGQYGLVMPVNPVDQVASPRMAAPFHDLTGDEHTCVRCHYIPYNCSGCLPVTPCPPWGCGVDLGPLTWALHAKNLP